VTAKTVVARAHQAGRYGPAHAGEIGVGLFPGPKWNVALETSSKFVDVRSTTVGPKRRSSLRSLFRRGKILLCPRHLMDKMASAGLSVGGVNRPR